MARPEKALTYSAGGKSTIALADVTFLAEDIPSAPYGEILDCLHEKSYVCIRGLFSPSEVLEARQRMEERFDPKADRKHDSADADLLMGNFQKLFIGGTTGVNSVPRFLRMFYNPPMAEDIFGLHGIFRRLIRVRNLLYGLPETFTLNGVEQGFWTATRINHYPRGGGFMASHTDHITSAVAEDMGMKNYIQVLLIMSRFGVDFKSGGAFVEIGGKRVFYESESELGDVMIYDGRSRHGVQEIDPMEPLDMASMSGRCAAFATLFKHFTQNSVEEYSSLRRQE